MMLVRRRFALLVLLSGILAACRTSASASAAPRPTPTAGTRGASAVPTVPPVPSPIPMPTGRNLESAASALVPAIPTRLVIPRVDLDAPVVEIGIKLEGGRPVWETARHAAGYHRGSGIPGRGGNIVLSGHISSWFHGNVFRKLPEVVAGDGVVIMTGDQQSYLYEVVSTQVVLPTAVEMLDPTREETVTLITCVPDGLFTHRLIVRAPRV